MGVGNMRLAELLVIAVGLSMDAFAVSVCKGLSVRKLQIRHALLAGLYFGGFQFLMPVLGWLLGYRFEALITSVDHWIAFGLLGVFLGPVALSLFNTMVRAYANIDGNAGAASLALSGPSSGSGAAASDEDHDASAGDRSKEAEETSGSGSPKEGEKP